MNIQYEAAMALAEELNKAKVTLTEEDLKSRLNSEWRNGYQECLKQIRDVIAGKYQSIHEWDEEPSGLQEDVFEAIGVIVPQLMRALDMAYSDAISFLNEGDFKRHVEWDAGYISDALNEAHGVFGKANDRSASRISSKADNDQPLSKETP